MAYLLFKTRNLILPKVPEPSRPNCLTKIKEERLYVFETMSIFQNVSLGNPGVYQRAAAVLVIKGGRHAIKIQAAQS